MKEGTTNDISVFLDLINVKDSHNFYVGVSKSWLFVAIQLDWNFRLCCFYFFPNSVLWNRECGLSMDAAYTRTFTLSFLCYFLFWNKTNEKLFRRSHSTPTDPSERIRRVSVRAISSFVDTSENKAKKIQRHNCTRLLPRGWGLDVHWSFHESLKTNFNWSESLALSCEVLKLSMIGYLSRKLPCKLLTIIYKEEPLPLTFLCCYWIC